MSNPFNMACRWCGKIFRNTYVLGYCSEECKKNAREYHSEMRENGYEVTVKEACEIHRREKGIVIQKVNDPELILPAVRVLAPVKVTSSATQWRYVPIDQADKTVTIIKGGRNNADITETN